MTAWRRILLSLVAAVTIGSTLTPMVANAGPNDCLAGTINGRPDCYGYFTGVPYAFDGTWDNIVSGGLFVPTTGYTQAQQAAWFISRMNGYLNGSSSLDQTGAAFLIDVMLGKNGPDFGGSRSAGIAYARANFGEWSKLVNYYSSQGLVNWNYDWTTPSPWYVNSAIGRSQVDAFYHTKPAEVIRVIRFYDPVLGTDMMIQRSCGNMVGTANRLTKPNYTLDPALANTSPGFNGTVVPDGTTYRMTPSVRNTSSGFDSDRFNLEVGIKNTVSGVNTGQYVIPVGVSPPYVSPATAGTFKSSGCFGSGGVSRCWNWYYPNGLDKSLPSIQTNKIAFRVSPSAPEGSRICFNVSVDDWNFDDVLRTEEGFCFVVHHPRFVSVQGHNSDIQAGGGPCENITANPTTGVITGNSGATGAKGTYGDYVVSASAAINNFSSNGTTTAPSSNTLKLGRTGLYAQVCRPDLVKAAQAYQAAGGGYSSIGSLDLTVLNSLPYSNYDVFFATGSISIHGTVNRKITIVALNGTVTIDGPIQISTAAYTRSNVPSLGIISANNIRISNAVTRVDAYMFANGIIDTCYQGSTSARTVCNSTLTVNGFVMARTLSLKRAGPSGSINTQIGENISLNPQIYLNPPKLFDASVDDVLLEGQGERQPLF